MAMRHVVPYVLGTEIFAEVTLGIPSGQEHDDEGNEKGTHPAH